MGDNRLEPLVLSEDERRTLEAQDRGNGALVHSQASEGAFSHYVVAIQMFVDSQEICPSLNLDGSFGPLTFKGVECFQKEYSLHIDGIVGPQTWTAMRNALYHYNTVAGWSYFYSNGVGAVDFRRNDTTGVWYYGGPNTSSKWTRMDTNAP
jgi:peptidoglycan hydrolase-like protein with peptidoglycan-binding domain